MIKKYSKLGAIAALLVAGFILAGSVSAFGMGGMKVFASDETRSEMENALATNDYDAFVAIQTKNFPNAPVLSEEKFAQISAMQQTHAQLEAAIVTGDYATWKKIMSENPSPHSTEMIEKITAENFHLLKELHDAQATIERIHGEIGLVNNPHFAMNASPGMRLKVMRGEGKEINGRMEVREKYFNALPNSE